MCTTYSVLSCKLATGFSIFSVFMLFQFSFFQVKMVNHYEVYIIFQDIEHQLRESITFFIIVFYEIFLKLRSVPLKIIHSKLFTGSFCNIAQPYK